MFLEWSLFSSCLCLLDFSCIKSQFHCLCRMSMEDFCGNFSEVDMCCSDMNVLAGSRSSSWRTEAHSGQWVMETTAGGCPNHPGTHYHLNTKDCITADHNKYNFHLLCVRRHFPQKSPVSCDSSEDSRRSPRHKHTKPARVSSAETSAGAQKLGRSFTYRL